jgi:hypothetical protein
MHCIYVLYEIKKENKGKDYKKKQNKKETKE